VTELLAHFEGLEHDQRVRLSVYDSHLEIAAEGESREPVIRVPLDELGRVVLEEVLGMTALVIEDTAGIVAATVRMEPDEAARAIRIVNQLQRQA
jgi:hypothetical protein